nr:PAS domain S-box protein [Myxococcota bacterium]
MGQEDRDDPVGVDARATMRAVFDRALDAMLLVDDQGRCADANAAACTTFGLPREQLVGRHVSELVGAAGPDAEPWRSLLGEREPRGTFWLHRPGAPPQLLEHATTANVRPGLHLSVLREITNPTAELAAREARLRALLDHSSEVITLHDIEGQALVANVRDVTERYEAADALRESDAQYRRVFEATPDAVIVHVDGRIQFANAAAARDLGVGDAAALVGRSIAEFAEEGIRTAEGSVPAPELEPPAGDALRVVEQQLRRESDGHVITAEVSTTRFVFGGRPAAVSVARDVTERK